LTLKARRELKLLGALLLAAALANCPARASESSGDAPAALQPATMQPATTALPAAALQPLWEAGLGIGALGYEDYRGADSSHAYPVPVPYLVYNGAFLRSDRAGLHGNLFKQPWVDIRLSFNATTPVSNDRTRSGMPQLRPTLEAGVSLDFHLWQSGDERVKWDLRMPLRSAFAIESPPEATGWTFSPAFALDVVDHVGYDPWKLGFLAGPLFANRRYNSYFYSVQAQFATAARPEYQASGGYAGAEFLTALSKRFPKYWVGAFMRVDSLSGAAFERSPLVQRDRYWTAGFGIAWPIRTSSQRVEVPD
jgi:outer membrane scaffolding protein for murein synthesis (MipA/OmpV family)